MLQMKARSSAHGTMTRTIPIAAFQSAAGGDLMGSAMPHAENGPVRCDKQRDNGRGRERSKGSLERPVGMGLPQGASRDKVLPCKALHVQLLGRGSLTASHSTASPIRMKPVSRLHRASRAFASAPSLSSNSACVIQCITSRAATLSSPWLTAAVSSATVVHRSDSRQLRCSNMLTPQELVDAEERATLKEDVSEECAQFGAIEDIKIPTSDNAPCNIYVRFAAPAAAAAALAALRGRKFDGREVEVALCAREAFDALIDGA